MKSNTTKTTKRKGQGGQAKPHITRVSMDEALRLPSLTDWGRVKNMPESEVRANAESDSDNPLWTAEMLKKASAPEGKKETIAIRLDSDVLKAFKAQGPGYQSRINKVLRTYIEASRR